MFVFHRQNIPYLNLDKSCVEGQLYLVEGDDISRGRVQYCYEGVCYSLCGDEWNGEESRVVCQTLGYDTSIYGTIIFKSLHWFKLFFTYAASVLVNYGRGRDPILPLRMECGSDTSTFGNCSTMELDVNKRSSVAGVDCVGR